MEKLEITVKGYRKIGKSSIPQQIKHIGIESGLHYEKGEQISEDEVKIIFSRTKEDIIKDWQH